MTYTVKHTTQYPGGHAEDPGYRFVRVEDSTGRSYGFYCDPDGSNVRRIGTRPAGAEGAFRKIAARHADYKAPELEAAIKTYLDAQKVVEMVKGYHEQSKRLGIS